MWRPCSLFRTLPLPRLALLLPMVVSLLAGWVPEVRAAAIEADVEQDDQIISDALGFAFIGEGETATVAVYLLLDPGELASAFEAGFDLSGAEAMQVEVDLSRVDPGLAPLGVGTWTDTEANIVGDQVRVSLLRDNLGGDSLVADIVVTSIGGPGLFEVLLADREATGDLDDPPFFQVVPIGTASGTVLATIEVPEPDAMALAVVALLVASALARVARAPIRSGAAAAGPSRPG